MPKIKVEISHVDYSAMSESQRRDLDAYLRYNLPLTPALQKLAEQEQQRRDASVAEQEQKNDADARALERQIARKYFEANPVELLKALRNESTENNDDV
jgi:hypothetical protein